MDADVGPDDGTLLPWCLERTVRDGAVELRDEDGFRRGWSARKATKGYVVA